jgi:hypothetical protein
MKNIYPSKPVIEQLNVQRDEKTSELKLLLFTPLTKEQHDLFEIELTKFLIYPKTSNKRVELNALLYKFHNFTFSDIIGLGDTSIDTRLANTYIESEIVKINDIVKRTCKCFVNKDWRTPKNNIIYHEDGGCSWNCLMEKLKHPKYGIIFTIRFEDKSKFKIND